jgi:hypothetical protein
MQDISVLVFQNTARQAELLGYAGFSLAEPFGKAELYAKSCDQKYDFANGI